MQRVGVPPDEEPVDDVDGFPDQSLKSETNEQIE